MQSAIQGADGLSRSSLAFGVSSAAAGANAVVEAIGGIGAVRQNHVVKLAQSVLSGSNQPAPSPTPTRARRGTDRTLRVDGVALEDLDATPMPKGRARRGSKSHGGISRSMLQASGDAGRALGSRAVAHELQETMGIGMGRETTYGIYGGSHSTLRPMEFEDATVRPEDIVEERSWREYGIAAPLA